MWPLLEGGGHVGCDYYWKGEGKFGVTILEGGVYVWCDHYWKGVGMFGVTIIGRGWVCLV